MTQCFPNSLFLSLQNLITNLVKGDVIVLAAFPVFHVGPQPASWVPGNVLPSALLSTSLTSLHLRFSPRGVSHPVRLHTGSIYFQASSKSFHELFVAKDSSPSCRGAQEC